MFFRFQCWTRTITRSFRRNTHVDLCFKTSRNVEECLLVCCHVSNSSNGEKDGIFVRKIGTANRHRPIFPAYVACNGVSSMELTTIHTQKKKGWDETGLRTSITFIYAFPSPVTCVIYNVTIRYPTRGSLLFLLSICAEHTHLRLLLIRLCVLWTPILKHTILFTSRCSNRIKFRLSFLPPAIVAHCLLVCCCSPLSVVDVHRCAWFLPTGTARYAVYAAPLETFSLWDAI